MKTFSEAVGRSGRNTSIGIYQKPRNEAITTTTITLRLRSSIFKTNRTIPTHFEYNWFSFGWQNI